MSETRTAARAARRPRAAGMYASRRIDLLYLPAVALFAVFTVYPLVNGLMLSLTNWNGYSPEYSLVGLANYGRLAVDPVFQGTLRNTFVYGLGSTAIQQVIGLALALALDRPMRGRNVLPRP